MLMSPSDPPTPHLASPTLRLLFVGLFFESFYSTRWPHWPPLDPFDFSTPTTKNLIHWFVSLCKTFICRLRLAEFHFSPKPQNYSRTNTSLFCSAVEWKVWWYQLAERGQWVGSAGRDNSSLVLRVESGEPTISSDISQLSQTPTILIFQAFESWSKLSYF